MKPKLLLIDFYDSFTFNLAAELYKYDCEIDVINYDQKFQFKNYQGLIWGPGPGCPNEYKKNYPLFKEMMNSKIPILAVCLGHQIYWEILGQEISSSLKPLHGHSERYELNKNWKKFFKTSQDFIQVQRYNSLSVKTHRMNNSSHLLFVQDEELIMSANHKHITYQFHPESIGTLSRQIFFRPFIQRLKL